MKFPHCVVWLDHRAAKVIRFDRESSQAQDIRHEGGERHLHHKRGAVGAGHASEDPAYYEAIVSAVGDTPEILVTGPANAKLELIKHVHRRHASLVDRIIGVETRDHPSEGQLLDFARRYFNAADRMLPGAGIASPGV